jgi:butyrate response factor 1
MPSVDSNSSYSSSDSSTSSLSSPRALLTDIRPQQAIQQQQQPHYQMKTTTSSTPPQITQPHICVTRYKTELCRPFTETGKCKYGDKCQFSHGIKELRILMRHPKYKTEYCRTFHTSKNSFFPSSSSNTILTSLII